MHIELRHINKSFGTVRANQDISLTFEPGQIVGILGENGAGKSTLMKILSGYQPADSGDIVIDGNVNNFGSPQAAIDAGIGMLQQDPLDVGAFTVLENFIFGKQQSSSGIGQMFFSKRRAADELHAMSTRFGFSLNADMLIRDLSIAQRQQLEIVRLLAQGVQTLILDEPTTGISAEQKTLLFDTLRDLADDGMIVLLVSHKLEDVITLCDEVAVLRTGQVVGTREMPATKQDLVSMMFGDQVEPQQRTRRNLQTDDIALNVDGLTVTQGRITVADFNLRVNAGEVIGFAGLDGSGQEVLLRTIAGLISAQQGSISVAGTSLAGKSHHAFRKAGLVFGAAGRLEEGLVAGLTLTEHVALAETSSAFIDWSSVREQTGKKIKHYDVRGRADDTIDQLSGGNQQRVLMAMLPARPDVMILEQPTRGLDVDSAAWIWQQLLDRCERGAALLFSSVDLDELLTYSDRIVVCFAGRVYHVDDPSTLTNRDLGHLIGGDFEGNGEGAQA